MKILSLIISIMSLTATMAQKPGIVHDKARGLSYTIAGYDTSFENTIKPTSKEQYLEMGLTALINDYQTDAFIHFTQAISIDSNYADAYYYRGICYLLTHQFKQAGGELDFQKAITLNPTKKYFLAYLSLAESASNLDTTNFKFYNKVIAMKPNDARLFAARGYAMSVIHKSDQAIKDFNTAIQLDSNYYWTYFVRGLHYWEYSINDQQAYDDILKAEQFSNGTFIPFLAELKIQMQTVLGYNIDPKYKTTEPIKVAHRKWWIGIGGTGITYKDAGTCFYNDLIAFGLNIN